MQKIESPTIYLTDHPPRDKTAAEFFDDFTAMRNANDDLLENFAVASRQSERELQQYVSAESNPMNETQDVTLEMTQLVMEILQLSKTRILIY